MHARPRSLAFLLSVSVLTGCAVGPDYRPPETALSARFLGQEDVEQREVQGKANLQAWWVAFDDPLLTRFVLLALEQNLDIAQAAARVAQSRASLRQADAALLPSASVSAHGAEVYQSVETPLGQVLAATPDFDRSGSAFEANLDAGWEIDMFGGLRRGREAEALTAYRQAVLRATEEVESAFSALVKREAQVGILAQREIRMRVPEGLQGRGPPEAGIGALFHLVQSGAAPPGIG